MGASAGGSAGEAFGLFGLVSRIAAVVGPLVWGLVLWAAAPMGQARYKLATGVLFLFALAGWWMYNKVNKIPKEVPTLS